jgi:hypothetical protein
LSYETIENSKINILREPKRNNTSLLTSQDLPAKLPTSGNEISKNEVITDSSFNFKNENETTNTNQPKENPVSFSKHLPDASENSVNKQTESNDVVRNTWAGVKDSTENVTSTSFEKKLQDVDNLHSIQSKEPNTKKTDFPR